MSGRTYDGTDGQTEGDDDDWTDDGTDGRAVEDDDGTDDDETDGHTDRR